ncbi:MAG: chromosome partitioning protein ParB [Halobacteriovorax sp.]|nr:chromosome partitioning protein ParB [Halobacteriovorax sp.]|tara:strand:- start:334065 stop:334967 length:903 start_codon:yes stop_codon:yes gene_type:complete
MAKKIALGKGIASLIQETPNEILSQSLKDLDKADGKKESEMENNPCLVDINSIVANPGQPRKIFKEKDLDELAESIKENGIIQPLLISKAEKGFELIAGERRLRAAKKAGLEKVPAIIKRGTDKDKMVMSIIENVQRSDLNCVEEALAYYNLMDDFKLSQEEVAKKVGKERSTIANFLRILKLPRAVLEMVQKDFLTFGHAKVLAGVQEREKAIRLGEMAVAEQWSVRELEKKVKSNPMPKSEPKRNVELEQKLDGLKGKLEQRTGFHFQIKGKKAGSGEIVLKYTNEAEFNDIFEYLMK